ncbi:MAG: hypothetical protein ABW199_10470 [Caulobacterales bacterium]
MRAWLIAAALALTACSTSQTAGGPNPEPPPGPLPTTGPILYTCADGTQLTVDYADGQARVAVIGGVSMTLPMMGADYYSNGRYSVRGRGAQMNWGVGRAVPTTCRGS